MEKETPSPSAKGDTQRPERSEPAGSASANGADHFDTDHLVQNLGTRAVSGGLVTLAAQAAKFALNIGSAVILARLLIPEDFGLVGMILALTGILGMLKEAGLSTATLQREVITAGQVSNLFWINTALGAMIGLVCIGLAPAVAWFFRDPRLTGIMVALSFTFFLTGPTVQHQALLTRQMRFKAIALIEVGSMLAGILAGCALALSGFRYWALVGMQLVVAAAGMVLTWWASGWRPTLPQRNSGVGPLLKFGAHITASDLIGRVAANSDSILVGRFFGPGPLGLYSRASVLLARPMEQLLTPISSVLIPVLCRLQSDPERYRRTFLRAYDLLALVTFPFVALCLALSEPIVHLLLGPKWGEAVPLFAGLTLVALSLPMSVSVIWLFTSQGRGRDQLRAYVFLSFVTVAGFVAGLPWGPLGVVLAFAATSLLIRLPYIYYAAGRSGPVRTADLWKSFVSHLPCWGAVYLPAALVQRTLEGAQPLIQIIVCGSVGLVTGTAAVLAFERPRASTLDAWRTVKNSLAGERSG